MQNSLSHNPEFREDNNININITNEKKVGLSEKSIILIIVLGLIATISLSIVLIAFIFNGGIKNKEKITELFCFDNGFFVVNTELFGKSSADIESVVKSEGLGSSYSEKRYSYNARNDLNLEYSSVDYDENSWVIFTFYEDNLIAVSCEEKIDSGAVSSNDLEPTVNKYLSNANYMKQISLDKKWQKYKYYNGAGYSFSTASGVDGIYTVYDYESEESEDFYIFQVYRTNKEDIWTYFGGEQYIWRNY